MAPWLFFEMEKPYEAIVPSQSDPAASRVWIFTHLGCSYIYLVLPHKKNNEFSVFWKFPDHKNSFQVKLREVLFKGWCVFFLGKGGGGEW